MMCFDYLNHIFRIIISLNMFIKTFRFSVVIIFLQPILSGCRGRNEI